MKKVAFIIMVICATNLIADDNEEGERFRFRPLSEEEQEELNKYREYENKLVGFWSVISCFGLEVKERLLLGDIEIGDPSDIFIFAIQDNGVGTLYEDIEYDHPEPFVWTWSAWGKKCLWVLRMPESYTRSFLLTTTPSHFMR